MLHAQGTNITVDAGPDHVAKNVPDDAGHDHVAKYVQVVRLIRRWRICKNIIYSETGAGYNVILTTCTWPRNSFYKREKPRSIQADDSKNKEQIKCAIHVCEKQ